VRGAILEKLSVFEYAFAFRSRRHEIRIWKFQRLLSRADYVHGGDCDGGLPAPRLACVI
jgi:hypothetical protein